MPINEQVINNLLDNATPSNSSDRVYFVEPGNMMTAMSYFKRITGQQLGLDALSQKASGGFFVHTYNGMINGQQVNVNLRGGSTSDVTYTRLVHVLSVSHQLVDAEETSQVAHGVPTIDITNPGALNGVPRLQNAQGRVEFKFTNRFSYEATR